MNPKNVELHIEQLILLGFAPGDRYRISAAIEHGLAQLIAEQGIPPTIAREGEITSIDGEKFNIAPDTKAEAIGAQIAKSVYESINM